MFVVKLFACVGALIAIWFVVWCGSGLRGVFYRNVGIPMMLSYDLWEGSAYRIRKNLEGITTWLHGSVFISINGKLLAHLCLSILRDCEDFRNPNLIRMLEVIKKYGTLGQKASFERAVMRNIMSYAPILAPQFLDVLREHGFKVRPKPAAAVELASAHALRQEPEDVSSEQGEFRFLGAARRPRVKRAFARVRAHPPTPRKSQQAP